MKQGTDITRLIFDIQFDKPARTYPPQNRDSYANGYRKYCKRYQEPCRARCRRDFEGSVRPQEIAGLVTARKSSRAGYRAEKHIERNIKRQIERKGKREDEKQ